MEKEIIEHLEEVFPAKWFPNPLRGRKQVGWFLLEINPLPPLADLESVISDIIKDNIVDVVWGKVLHSDGCKKAKHSIPQLIKSVITNLENQTFYVAVYPGTINVYGGQPVAVAIEPQINYALYPDHPHLNPGQMTEGLNGEKIFIPDSFCYIDDPSILGTDMYERLLQAFCKITIWLLRHQVWIETRNLVKKGEWIGLEGKPLSPNEYPLFLNPFGLCRCGEKNQYIKCHMSSDLNSQGIDLTQSNKLKYIKHWTENISNSNNKTVQLLKKSMIYK